MTKDEIIKTLRDMAKYPTVTLPRDCEALRIAADLLAQPEQEPVAWMTHSNDLTPLFHKTRAGALNWQTQPKPLYTTPPQRKPLTDAQSERLYRNIEPSRQQDARSLAAFKRLLRVIEAAHGIKGEA